MLRRNGARWRHGLGGSDLRRHPDERRAGVLRGLHRPGRRRLAMRVRVLGSAAGGGVPQWNCGCANCRDARRGVAGVPARTQESVAVSADGERWLLLNASPDVRAQLAATSALHPRALRDTPIAAIALTSAELDHTLGLLSLREAQPLVVFATGAVRRAFRTGNVLCGALERIPGQTTWRQLGPAPSAIDGTGLSIHAIPVAGKPPAYRDGARAEEGYVVALV